MSNMRSHTARTFWYVVCNTTANTQRYAASSVQHGRSATPWTCWEIHWSFRSQPKGRTGIGNKVFICIGRTRKSCMKLSWPEHAVTPHIKPDERYSSVLLHILQIIPPDDIKESVFSVEVSPAAWRIHARESLLSFIFWMCSLHYSDQIRIAGVTSLMKPTRQW